MKTHANELILYFDSNQLSHKKTRAFAYSITNHINEYSFREHPFTKLMWQEILEMLQLSPKELLNKSMPEYQAMIAGKNFDDDGWLEILIKNPELIKAPIAIMQNKAVLCVKPKDIYKLIQGHEFEE